MSNALVTTKNLTVRFAQPRTITDLRSRSVSAVDNVSMQIERGSITGLVGESGSGKSTLGRALLRLVRFDGTANVAGFNVEELSLPAPRSYYKTVQAVLQDPAQALNPRHDVQHLLGEPLEIHSSLTPSERTSTIEELLASVELPANLRSRTSRELSGGQRQRVAIARALAVNPSLIILDEALSALDVTTAASIARLLRGLVRPDSAMLFIGHDLAMVRQLCDHVYVMQAGRIVEHGSAEQVCGQPTHEYTRLLVSSIPRLLGRTSTTTPTTSRRSL